MTKFSAFAAIVLFWVMLSFSLMRLQLTASPIYKVRVAHRSMAIGTARVAAVNHFRTNNYN
ncbi:hypothetical protein [Hymenobacter caeli]|uniref:hypothetical protein n=1 Tax=Hymenobacter caeli TaxID=2735894 RepID=UPI0036D2634B